MYVIQHVIIKIAIGIMESVKLKNVHLGVQWRISEMGFVTQNVLERNVNVMEATVRNVHLAVRFSGWGIGTVMRSVITQTASMMGTIV